MNRRKFLKLMGLLPVAPTVFSFGTGVRLVTPALSFCGVPIRLVDSLEPLTATEIVRREEERMLSLTKVLDDMGREMHEELLHAGEAVAGAKGRAVYYAHPELAEFKVRWENPNQDEIYGRGPGEEAMEFIDSMNRDTERQILASTGYHPEGN